MQAGGAPVLCATLAQAQRSWSLPESGERTNAVDSAVQIRTVEALADILLAIGQKVSQMPDSRQSARGALPPRWRCS